MSTATSLVRVVLRCAARGGIDPAELLARAGVDPATVEDRDARVPTRAYLEIFAAAVERTGDPAFGPAAAEALDVAAFGLLGFVVASCATLREAFGRLARYARLLCDELAVHLEARGDEVAVVYVLAESPHVPALFEMALVHLVATARKGTRGAFRPRRAVFRHHAGPRSLPELLGAPVELGGAEDALLVAREALDLPLRGQNPTLLGILEAHVAHVLEAMPRDDDLLARARVAVRALLPRGEPSLEAAARRLGLGARTLQRRLRERGLTFRALVDDVRRECALAQLAHPDVSIAEVAFSLGFSDPSAFHHAFRRWTGRTPGRRA